MATASRRTLLLLSVITSLALHGVMLVMAPYVQVLAKMPADAALLRAFRVHLVDETEVMRPAEAGNTGRGLGTRPGTIADMLAEDLGPLTPENSLLSQLVPVPQLEERVNREAAESPGDPLLNEETLKRVDAKILEISQQAARQDLAVTRRLVAPSPTRIFEEGEFPTLRGNDERMPEQALLIDPLPPRPILSPPGAAVDQETPSGAPAAGQSEWEKDVGAPVDETLPALPELPIEKVVARAPVSESIQKESKFEFIDDLVDMQVDAFVPPGERQGFFRLRIVPKEGETITPLPKDVTFIIDASNSILQRKLDQTVQGVRGCIQELRESDRFNVVIFRDTPTLVRPSLTYATAEEKAQALVFLTGVQSRGETDVYQGILPVISEPPRDGVPGIVVVMSDGKPTTGIKDGRTLINALTAQNENRHSIFAFAGGRTVNQHLLDLLAYRNKGEASFTPQLEAISTELPRFFSSLNDPILVDCAADFGRVNEENVFPKQLPDFYKGQAVTVYGRFDPINDKKIALRLTGRAGAKEKEVVFQADLAEAARGDRDIARNWAFRKIYYLIGEMTRVGETPELLTELRALAKEHNIRTSYDE
ncbi:MAG: VWA domain-containing protein [Candidatus Hydrogenedentes bacterium]|nr:VWA domain-containing protein [Candidatus Hydrogenedentota bacterium]